MVKLHAQRRDFFPSAGVVACLATLRECAAMRIAMAVRALPERNTRVAGFVVRPRRVALFASYLSVQAGQRELRFGMIELFSADRLPIGRVVTLRTVRT